MIVIMTIFTVNCFSFLGDTFLAYFAFFYCFFGTDAQGTDEFTLNKLHGLVVATHMIMVLTNLASFDAPESMPFVANFTDF